jgi:hypothetical protein
LPHRPGRPSSAAARGWRRTGRVRPCTHIPRCPMIPPATSTLLWITAIRLLMRCTTCSCVSAMTSPRYVPPRVSARNTEAFSPRASAICLRASSKDASVRVGPTTPAHSASGGAAAWHLRHPRQHATSLQWS